MDSDGQLKYGPSPKAAGRKSTKLKSMRNQVRPMPKFADIQKQMMQLQMKNSETNLSLIGPHN